MPAFLRLHRFERSEPPSPFPFRRLSFIDSRPRSEFFADERMLDLRGFSKILSFLTLGMDDTNLYAQVCTNLTPPDYFLNSLIRPPGISFAALFVRIF